MNAFAIKTSVDVHDVDFNGIAKTSAIMQYMQSAAQTQLTESGMSYERLRSLNKVFVISRFNMEIRAPLKAYTPLTAKSYVTESRGYTFLRCYQLEADGVAVARAVSGWALVDTKTKALVKVNDFDLGLPVLPQNSVTLSKFIIPENTADVGEWQVRYADTDQNMHMNNTKYPDLYSNFLPLKNKMISKLAINYVSEAPLGENLRVHTLQEGNRFYFRTVKSNGQINSEAEIEIADIS